VLVARGGLQRAPVQRQVSRMRRSQVPGRGKKTLVLGFTSGRTHGGTVWETCDEVYACAAACRRQACMPGCAHHAQLVPAAALGCERD